MTPPTAEELREIALGVRHILATYPDDAPDSVVRRYRLIAQALERWAEELEDQP